jgi:hypothetical protein
MQKKITYIDNFFSILSFGQKIKTITEFKRKDINKVRETI